MQVNTVQGSSEIMFNVFPTSPPPGGASWSFLTWKLEIPISSINRFGLCRIRIDRRVCSGLGVGDVSILVVGGDGLLVVGGDGRM